MTGFAVLKVDDLGRRPLLIGGVSGIVWIPPLNHNFILWKSQHCVMIMSTFDTFCFPSIWSLFFFVCEIFFNTCYVKFPRRWCKFITFFFATGSCIISSCSLLQVSWRPSYCCCGCSTSVRWQLSGKFFFFLYKSFNFLRLAGFIEVIYTGWYDLSLV